ncbi:hypothetical protein D3C80_1707270 [compost metagenome]
MLPVGCLERFVVLDPDLPDYRQRLLPDEHGSGLGSALGRGGVGQPIGRVLFGPLVGGAAQARDAAVGAGYVANDVPVDPFACRCPVLWSFADGDRRRAEFRLLFVHGLPNGTGDQENVPCGQRDRQHDRPARGRSNAVPDRAVA